jgi:hypothetical protein
LHPLIDVVYDVIGTLAKLKIDVRLRLRRLKIERERIRLADATRPGKYLPCRQKSQQRSENWRRELRLAFHQIILVATKRGTGVMIDVVFNKRHVTVCAQRND